MVRMDCVNCRSGTWQLPAPWTRYASVGDGRSRTGRGHHLVDAQRAGRVELGLLHVRRDPPAAFRNRVRADRWSRRLAASGVGQAGFTVVATHAEVLMTGARRGQLILSGVAVVVGAGGLVVARDVSFTAARGE